MTQRLQEQFLNPPDEFTPVPFWFWNDHLTEEEIIRQIHAFNDKGVNGFVLHPRIGIPKEIPYLSDYYMDLVYKAVVEADRLGMYVILYDEGMYPSGSANGLVVKSNPEYATRGLQMIEHPCEGTTDLFIDLEDHEHLISAQAVYKVSEHEIDFSKILVLEVKDGRIQFQPPEGEENWSIVYFVETFSEGTIRGIHFGEDDGEENAPASADLLNPDVVQKFIEITHDTYYSRLKDFFGHTIIAMFTDEPDLLGRNRRRGLQAWTTGFLTDFIQYGGEENYLPALWFEAGDQTANIRKIYRGAINQRLANAYYRQISEWCESHQIALTGHPQASDDIGLLEYFQIPGQDVVWRWVAPEDGKAIQGGHSTAGKCSSDAARHRGRRRNLNEVLGVCSREHPWDLSPGDKKWYLDWLFVRGVNMISPHAFYYSIDGRRRSHERPPDVGPNNHWWPFYHKFSTYIKRLSWLMTDSINQTEIAVLCEADQLPWKVVKPLFEHQIEFNYLEEQLLLHDCELKNGKLRIAQQEYSVIIIEDLTVYHDEVIQKLKEFIRTGGEVIVVHEEEDPLTLASKQIQHPVEIVDALPKGVKEEVLLSPADPSIRFSKVKKEEGIFYLFVNEGEESYAGEFHIKELGAVEKWDPWYGTIEDLGVDKRDGRLVVPLTLDRRESIIYLVNQQEQPNITKGEEGKTTEETIRIEAPWKISNEELAIHKEANLSLWNDWEGLENYSGTFIYENSFDIAHTEDIHEVILDLGEVYETAQVFINHNEVDVKMWAPYVLQVDPTLIKEGENHLRVLVKNTRANEMDQVSLPSGLIGPVTLTMVEEVYE